MPVSELDQRMSGEEFLDHMADCRLLECERERDDLRTAALMVAFNNAQGGNLTDAQALDALRVEHVSADAPSGPPQMSDDAMMAALSIFGRVPAPKRQ